MKLTGRNVAISALLVAGMLGYGLYQVKSLNDSAHFESSQPQGQASVHKEVAQSESGQLAVNKIGHAQNEEAEQISSYTELEAITIATEAFTDQMAALGYHAKSETDAYAHYPQNTLEDLLFAGDTRAYLPLIEQYLQARDLDRLVIASHVAAIHGSTPAISILAGQEASKADYALITGDLKTVHERLITANALLEMAALLGDPYSKHARERLAARFPGVEFSQEDRAVIEQLATQFKDGLNQIRQEKGLHSFDETVAIVNKYHHRLLSIE